jgi:hypothetical protein
MRKGKDPDPEPDPYLWLMDPDQDPGGPKTCGSDYILHLKSQKFRKCVETFIFWIDKAF